MKILRVKDIHKVYNLYTDHEFEALKGINFDVEEGEFIVVMGPSGSGKSTFINNISTIDLPTHGLVYINDIEVRTMSGNELGQFRYDNLGFIFQNFNLLDTHTLYENIAMPLSLSKVNAKETDERVHQLAKQMNIEAYLNKFPYECSGGQRQRAAICRALINHPKIIVADEPTGNLDSQNSLELMNILNDMNQDGVTIIMVTHDPLIASYSSRLIYIEDGQIIQELKRENLTQKEYYSLIMNSNKDKTIELL